MPGAENYTFALVGGGMYGEEYLRAFQQFPQAQVKWIVSRTPSTVSRLQTQYGIPYGTVEMEEMLADPAVDAVVVCSPPFAHAAQFAACVQAGKHVLLEKPMVVNRAEMERVLTLAEAHSELVLCEASARHARLQPKFRFVKQIIDSGELGEVYYIHYQDVYRQNRPGIEYNPPAKWFISRELGGGGPLVDWGEYDLSFHLGLLGDRPQLSKVSAFARRGMDHVDAGGVFDVEEHFAAFMEFDTGLTFYYERASNAHNRVPNETRIYGTLGGLKFSYLTWDTVNPVVRYSLALDGKTILEENILVDMNAHPGDNPALVAHFLDALAGSTPVAMPISLAAKHFDILMRVYEAAGF